MPASSRPEHRVHDKRPVIVAGIDVGGRRKGYHAVALVDGEYADHFSSSDCYGVANWCRFTVNATVVAVDAPCGWSKDGKARPAERQLMQSHIWCFSTPTRDRALSHPKGHYDWMLQGEALFKTLETTHQLCQNLRLEVGARYCFETFPHAATWHLLNGQASASSKRMQRKHILREAGLDVSQFKNIDFVDAAVCALVAHRALTCQPCTCYGEPDTGLIIVTT